MENSKTSRAGPRIAGPLPRWARPLAITCAALFVISTAFPVTAGLSKNTADFSIWWGRLDVGLAFVLAILALAIMALGAGKVNQQAGPATYRGCRWAW